MQTGRISSFIMCALIVAVIGSCSVMLHNDKVANKIQASKAIPKWNTWEKYRDTACKVVGQQFAIPYPAGKHTGYGNAKTYQCNNGVAYTVGQRVYENIQSCIRDAENCQIDLESIPEPNQ